MVPEGPEGANGGLSFGPRVVCLELPFVALLQGTHYIQEGSVSTPWALLVLLVNFVNLILFHDVSLVSLVSRFHFVLIVKT